MSPEEQADFLHAAFEVWWTLDGQGTCDREAAFAAFVAGFLAADNLLHQLAEGEEIHG